MYYRIELTKPFQLYVKDCWLEEVIKQLGAVNVLGYYEDEADLEKSFGDLDHIHVNVEPIDR